MTDALRPPLGPVADEVGVEEAGEPGPAFEEADLEAGEAPGYPSQEQGLARRFVGGGEAADMVEHVRWRATG